LFHGSSSRFHDTCSDGNNQEQKEKDRSSKKEKDRLNAVPFFSVRKPQDAAVLYFFTRYVKQAGARRKLSAVPWRAKHGGMTSGLLAQVPFKEMWVKTENWRTPQEQPYA